MTHRDEAHREGYEMSVRIRKLIGTVMMLIFIFTYALFAMAVAEGRITQAPKALQTVAYIVLGLIWIVPLMPLVRWMAKPDKS
jgi:predicted membrane channel-forming protein YqfA (hemolysin III family)